MVFGLKDEKDSAFTHKNGNFSVNQKIRKPEDSCWSTELDVVEDCGLSPKNITVLVSPLAKVKINLLMEKFPHTEWLAYLLGKDFIVEDLYIPRQEVTSASVSKIDTSKLNSLPVIGVIHSHHNMSTSFSGTDKNWINQNNDISLCVSHNKIDGQVRWKAPCGYMKTVPIIVKLNLEIEFDKVEFDNLIEENIRKPVFNKILPRRSLKNTIEMEDNDIQHPYGIYGDGFDDVFDKSVIPLDKQLLSSLEDKSLEEQLRIFEESGMFDDPDG